MCVLKQNNILIYCRRRFNGCIISPQPLYQFLQSPGHWIDVTFEYCNFIKLPKNKRGFLSFYRIHASVYICTSITMSWEVIGPSFSTLFRFYIRIPTIYYLRPIRNFILFTFFKTSFHYLTPHFLLTTIQYFYFTCLYFITSY